jgi:carbon-monoxide dehydrogenase large subunit
VVDAFAHLGVTDMTMPHTSYRVWQQLVKSGVAL